MTEAAARQRIETWLTPISAESPTGADARYEPLHEEIREEAAKIDSPSSGTTDWVKLAKDAEALTTGQAKDLLIQSYAAFALYQNEGLLGLASGLFLLSESMDRYWDDMYPPVRRIRARVNALGWLTEKLDTTLPETQVGADDHDAVAALDASVVRLRAVVADKFTDEAPALRPIADCVERMKMSLPERAGAAPGEDPASDTEPPMAPPEGVAADAGAAPPPAAVPGAAVPADAVPADAVPADAVPAEAAAAPVEAAPAAPKEATPEDLWAELVEASKKWTEPCPGDAPAGIDAKYELAHEELRADVAAADSPAGSALDWPAVVPRAGSVLADQSKDVLIASYLAFGLWERDSVAGLAVGLTVLQQICERYWEDCFPPVRRIRGRANAVSWLLDRIENPLPDVTLTAKDKKAVDQLVVATKHFSATVREKFEDAAPSIRPLQDNVKRLEMSVPAPAAPKPPPSQPKPQAAGRPAAAKPAASASVALGSGGAELGDGADVEKFALEVAGSLRKAATNIRRAAVKDPTSYLFTRVGLALRVKQPKPSEGSKTKVPAPQDQLVSGIDRAVAAEQWEKVVSTAEQGLESKPFWFDASRYSALALGQLGHEEAQRAVIAGTALLVVRFPEALDLTFNDGTPFCSDLTREWIGQEVMPSSGGGGGGGGGEGSELLAAARAAAAGGKIDEALTQLESLAHSGRSARARFLARLTMAQALATGKTVKAAEGIFSSLQAEIDRVSLETWEPELAADCYRSHLSCLKQMEKEPGAAEERVLVFRRLCRVDPLAASKVVG